MIVVFAFVVVLVIVAWGVAMARYFVRVRNASALDSARVDRRSGRGAL